MICDEDHTLELIWETVGRGVTRSSKFNFERNVDTCQMRDQSFGEAHISCKVTADDLPAGIPRRFSISLITLSLLHGRVADFNRSLVALNFPCSLFRKSVPLIQK